MYPSVKRDNGEVKTLSRPLNNPWDYPPTVEEFEREVWCFRNLWFRRRRVRW